MTRLFTKFDFDGTVADTLGSPPSGIGVRKACMLSLVRIFGEQAEERFEEVGGLRNRSPQELVELMLKTASGETFTRKARCYFTQNRRALQGFVPKGKGYPLFWKKDHVVPFITEVFTRVKLSLLVKQIGMFLPNGKRWPEPCPGFLEFYDVIRQENEKEPDCIQTAIVSSGHDFFIREVFKMWGVDCPAILLTDDDMRRRQYDEGGKPAKYMKPSSYLLELVHAEFAKANSGVLPDKSDMIFFGDDRSKDEMLAKNFGIKFGLFDATIPSCTYTENGFAFGNWAEMKYLLKAQSRNKIIM